MTRAIIVAAGRGRRLGRETDELPKCMVKVAGQPILHWQVRALTAAGVDDIVVVRGYRGDRIEAPSSFPLPLRFVENPQWAHNNILASLLYAAEEMRAGFFFSYSDIMFSLRVARQLADESADGDAEASLVIDRCWQDAYQGRTEHPPSEAELTRVAHDPPRVQELGKTVVAPQEAAGEFIGLARFSAAGAAALRAIWHRASNDGGSEAPFGRAATLRQAYLSDGLNAMAAQGARLRPIFIDGGWREIDTAQDLASAERNASLWA